MNKFKQLLKGKEELPQVAGAIFGMVFGLIIAAIVVSKTESGITDEEDLILD